MPTATQLSAPHPPSPILPECRTSMVNGVCPSKKTTNCRPTMCPPTQVGCIPFSTAQCT